MAVDRKISDLNPYPGHGKPQDDDLFISAREDTTNWKIPYSGLSQFSAERAQSVFKTGDQTINGVKSFNEFILGNVSGNLSGTARYVVDGVYTTGNQTIDGAKVFTSPITGNLTGTAQYVRDGVYVTGNQTIDGIKTFNKFILGNVSGNLSGTARYVQDGVYITGDQLISGLKDFDETPTVSGVPVLLSGDAVDLIHLHGKNHESIEVKKGTPVYISGAAGNNPLLAIAKNSQERTSSKTIGLLAQDLNVNEHGFVVSEGLLEGIDTSAAIDGDPMWLGPTGEIIYGINNKPFGANHLVYLGVVLRSQKNNGKVYVKVQNGFEIDELHEVYARNPEDKDTLLYNQASGYWFSRQITTGDVSGINSYVENFTGIVRTTGNQLISGIKTFDSFIVGNASGNLSGTARYVQDGVYITGNQDIDGRKNFIGDLWLSGSPVLTEDNFGGSIENVVYQTGDQIISGNKIFDGEIIPSGGILSSGNFPMVFTDGRDPSLFAGPDKSLTMAFENSVFITGGVGGELADLHVEGTVYANQIDAVEEIIGEDGPMVFTDGRDPVLFAGPDKSLTMAFQNSVFITGGVGGELADLHVEGTVYANQIDAVEEIIGEDGPMVFTDGRDPALFTGPDKSLTMAFQSGVFITGGTATQPTNLHVEGTGVFSGIIVHGEIDARSLKIEEVNAYDYVYSQFSQGLKNSFYIPIIHGEGSIQDNQQPFPQQGHMLLAPRDGRVTKIKLRARNGSANPGDVTFSICSGNASIINPSTDITVMEARTIASVDQTNTYTFDFSNSRHFSEDTAFLIKASAQNITNAIWNVTAEVIYEI